MGRRQSLLPLSTALLALSLAGLNAQLIPQTHLLVDQGCVGYQDHFLNVYSWACAGEGLGGKITPDPESNYYHITVYTMWETNQKNPPRLSKPRREQTFQWNGYKGDVLVSQRGCLRTATSGLDYEWIGECPAGIYLQKKKISDPYWQKQDFLLQNPQFETPADPITGADQVSVPEISSPEISFSDQTPSTFDTEQVSNGPLANGFFDISDPIPLANGLPTKNSPLFLANGAVPESSQPAVADSSSPDWPSPNDKFVVKRSRKQTAGHRG